MNEQVDLLRVKYSKAESEEVCDDFSALIGQGSFQVLARNFTRALGDHIAGHTSIED